nr:unnamed protein product [Callosobruchus analis]
MDSEIGELPPLKDEEIETKHEALQISDMVPGINSIKTEHSPVDSDKRDIDSKESVNTMGEQVFVKKEIDQDAEGAALTSIKSELTEPDWAKYDEEDKSILEMEAENYKLDIEMCGHVKQELKIKKEWDDDPDTVHEVSTSRIKKEKSEADILEEDKVKQEADMEEEEYKLITEDCDIKSESEEASMDATSDAPSNR